MKILLVEPDFPIPPKSKNHKNFLPIGLLKLASYHREKGDRIKLIRGNKTKVEIRRGGGSRWWVPDEILVTSLFTYWASYVKDCIQYYRELYPGKKIIVGGIYASLLPKDEVKEYTECDEVYQGVEPEAEKCFPAYDLIENTNPHPIDYQIVHASRGCSRYCDFCGTWQIEPKFDPKKSIRDEIKRRKIVFYDNNFLLNDYVEDVLNELIELKNGKKILWCESQSGFDGRKLKEKPHLAKMIKEAGFRYPRIAWDWGYNQHKKIKEQIDILVEAGYNSKNLFIFMIYNWDMSFEEMEKKRVKCWEWKIQIADCRYRPLDQTYDRYKPRKTGQTNEEYYIHKESGWTDELVKQFRKNVRRQNICIRQGFNYHSSILERKKLPKEEIIKYKKMEFDEVRKHLDDVWNPGEVYHPDAK